MLMGIAVIFVLYHVTSGYCLSRSNTSSCAQAN
ncbi:hypothetical protein GLYMA_02G118212v4 [Glycine max]|nr:hypothetical protein GLYMA_02G130864v4 [Glycine max]KAG4402134.1 hypothetical protein GLYMA_02G118212v4 [Glycine max]KAH1059107.1 hypothetical protein GYH30_003255 [Glycine max]